jgi:hypothetical protein
VDFPQRGIFGILEITRSFTRNGVEWPLDSDVGPTPLRPQEMTSDRKETLCADFSNVTARASVPHLHFACPIASARNQRRAR